MNKDEYVIINRTKLQQKIQDLEKDVKFYTNESMKNEANQCLGASDSLKNILLNSIELIPEIEKAFDEGSHFKEKWFKEIFLSNSDIVIKEPNVQNYINQLKLDI